MDDIDLQRLALQAARHLQRLGIDRIPPGRPVEVSLVPASSAAGVSPSATRPSVAAGRPVGQPPAAAAPPSARVPERPAAKPAPLTPSLNLPAASNMTKSTRPREERVACLAAVAERVAACTRCTELATTRTQTVFGVGNPEAELMFLGEAPGADEDAQGEPFVGRAGQLLNKIIEASRLTREEVYICNILRCRPPGNRNPTPEEAGHCREYLDEQIALVDPDYIVCLGTIAAQNLLGVTTPIGKMRGSFQTHGRAKVLCTYHPSYLLRNPSAKKFVWEDMKYLRRDMGVEIE